VSTADLTITELRDRIQAGGATSEGAVSDALERIDSLNPDLNAFTQVFRDEALARAREIDARGAAAAGPLGGVPVAIKDNLCTTLGRTTCGSRFLEHYESPFNATCVQRLLDAGAVIVGKTNLDEFAMGSSTEHSAFGTTGNPWDRARTPGGSSGGSAAAVAGRMVPLALGSDTGGSIRQPAALCGVVGYKPTYGLVSRYGLVAFASSLDQVGPITRSVDDAALASSVMFGNDPRDATSVRTAPPELAPLETRTLAGAKLGVPKQVRELLNDADVSAAFDAALATVTDAGAEIVEVDIPSIEYGIAAYYIVAPAEASSNLARFDGVRYGRRAEQREGDDLVALYSRSRSEGFGHEVQRRIMLGTHVLSSGYYDAYYNTALKVRRVITNDFERVFASVDAVLTPSTPEPAFRLGEKTDDPLALYLQDIFTVSANLTGAPAVSIPSSVCERENTTLPIGMQLMGPAFGDAPLLGLARALEGAFAFTAQPAGAR